MGLFFRRESETTSSGGCKGSLGILRLAVLLSGAFFAGVNVGFHYQVQDCNKGIGNDYSIANQSLRACPKCHCPALPSQSCPVCQPCPQATPTTTLSPTIACPKFDCPDVSPPANCTSTTSKADKPEFRFPPKVRGFAFGVSRVRKEPFLNTLDYGYPEDLRIKQGENRQEVLILYNQRSALPTNRIHETRNAGTEIPLLSVEEATENCAVVSVVRTMGHSEQCLAVVGDYESSFVETWMRIKPRKPVNMSLPLVPVGQGMKARDGSTENVVPHPFNVIDGRKKLKRYLDHVGTMEDELKPLLEKVAKNNTVIVMTGNLGQAELLVNFVCSARARGLDLSNIIMFPTDEATERIAQSLGITAYYSETNFEHISTEHAKAFGDATFGQIMYVKIVAVQIVNWLGYDLLFQDLDVVWYQDPMSFFLRDKPPYPEFDLIFQDDGSRIKTFAPYGGNSGFYFVRSNHRTKYLMNTLLLKADALIAGRSHQQVLMRTIAEQATIYGLRAKILAGEDSNMFPSGGHYHNRLDLMRSIGNGSHVPYVLHFAWTQNKENKEKFLQQMGVWHVQEQCSSDQLKGETATISFEACCSASPIITCHYRDKPSSVPCPDSPFMDQSKTVPFWPDDEVK